MPEIKGKSKLFKSIAVAAVATAGGVLLLAALSIVSGFGGASEFNIPVYEVEKDMMSVSVSAGGALQAMESHEVESKVEGQTNILHVVPEGTTITEEDVEEGKVILELDASDARDELEQQEITVQDAEATFAQAKEDYTIQKEENESDIAEARRKVRFARMELDRYLGEELAEKAVEDGLDFESAKWQEELGGAALQELRRLESDVSLAEEELSRSEDELQWTEQLVEEGYVDRNELEADRLDKKRREVEVESAKEELELFLRYTLFKEVEERLADYEEAKRSHERTNARARSRMTQAEADLRSAQSAYEMQEERKQRQKKMIENSVVEASRTGIVVYASTTNPRQYRDGPVEEGLTVREGQTILTIPDLSTLAARVDVPETQARAVTPGQTAEITLDAMPDESWDGKVRRISPMASEEVGMRALTGGDANYETDVAFTGIDGDNELQPGMSATAEIEAARVEDALSVPIHAVQTIDGRRVCWVAEPDGPAIRQVQLGYYTDTHVQVEEGLQEGDRVLLQQPDVDPDDVPFEKLPEELRERPEDITDMEPPAVEEDPPQEEGPPVDPDEEESIPDPDADSPSREGEGTGEGDGTGEGQGTGEGEGRGR